MGEPNIIKTIQSEGEVDDMLDYIVNNKLMAEVGMGYTACKPSLVEIENEGKTTQAIKMGIDNTFVNESGQVMGYGIVGHIYLKVPDDPSEVDILYMTPKEELEEKVQYILDNDIEATPRPRGKY